MQGPRSYLDWNATTPLCADAKAAMIAAMDVVGNPSSVHAEGRAAKAIIETARMQVAEAFGATGADIVFTSSATESAALAMAGRDLHCGGIEHDAVKAWAQSDLAVDAAGKVAISDPASSALQIANSETGIVQQLPAGLAVTDATQAFGKITTTFNWMDADMALVSAHKLGGPKGVGALVLKQGLDLKARIKGGGQEMGRRAGTENVVGIAGFGAAAQAGARDLANGVWENVAALRDLLEATLADAAPDTIFVGQGAQRLPNTSCIVTTGWKGETQVMLMDLSGFAISAGSACSSGKVKTSQVLQAMGYDTVQSSCAIRVSLGPTSTKEDVLRFADTWITAQKRFRAKAA
ncbi:MAG: cysteine desulfurase family protein [Paracoccaceae bacterium]